MGQQSGENHLQHLGLETRNRSKRLPDAPLVGKIATLHKKSKNLGNKESPGSSRSTLNSPRRQTSPYNDSKFEQIASRACKL
jgi:hypothetical protein